MVTRNVPLAQQLVLEVIAQIESRELAREDGQLPSEADLCQRFEVSRATVREALARLELAGVIIRRQGIGTFVNPNIARVPGSVQSWMDEAEGFLDLIRSGGGEASSKVLTSASQPAGELGEALGIAPDQPVLALTKLLYSSGVPVILCANVIPYELVRAPCRSDAVSRYRESESTYHFLADCCGLKVHLQRGETKAVPADECMADLLGCRQGDPLLRTEEVAYSPAAVPLFYGLNHFRGDMVSFRQVRRPRPNINGLT